jgi:hypothetical protein
MSNVSSFILPGSYTAAPEVPLFRGTLLFIILNKKAHHWTVYCTS